MTPNPIDRNEFFEQPQQKFRRDFPEDDWLAPYRKSEEERKEYFEDRIINEDLLPPMKTEPESNPTIMGKVLKTVKRFGGLVAGLLGTGGGLAAGLDINSAILIGVTAAVALIAGDLALAKEFKELFDDDPTNDKIEL